MVCFYSLTAFASPAVPGKKRKISFKFNDPKFVVPPQELQLPCGQCNGCRLQRSQHWAVRCMNELYDATASCFITLTYNDTNLPTDGTLVVKHFQDFMKRLRKRYGSGIRFFQCGEYGDKLGRPHYHAIIFGFCFDDLEFFKNNNGSALYRSASLEKLWTFGYSTVGNVTWNSIAYVARYVLKKVNGKDKDAWYGKKKPEYITMSRRPGIGARWFDRFYKDVYPLDTLMYMHNSKVRKIKPPRFYDTLYERCFPDDFEKVKVARCLRAEEAKLSGQLDADRLRAREIIVNQRLKKLIRPLSANVNFELAFNS